MIYITTFYKKGCNIPVKQFELEADSLQNARQVIIFMVESNDPELNGISFDRWEVW